MYETNANVCLGRVLYEMKRYSNSAGRVLWVWTFAYTITNAHQIYEKQRQRENNKKKKKKHVYVVVYPQNPHMCVFLQCFYAHWNSFKGALLPHDVAYWSEQHKSHYHGVRDEELRPYFPLQNVLKGMFGLAEKLFGIRIQVSSA